MVEVNWNQTTALEIKSFINNLKLRQQGFHGFNFYLILKWFLIFEICWSRLSVGIQIL